MARGEGAVPVAVPPDARASKPCAAAFVCTGFFFDSDQSESALSIEREKREGRVR